MPGRRWCSTRSRRLIRHEYPDADSLIYARNVTDVDDKIIASAEAEGVDASVITERYERIYLEDMGALGVNPPTSRRMRRRKSRRWSR